MSRWSALLFVAVIFLLIPSVVSAQESRWGWLPPNVNSAYGYDIDTMYLVIMVVVIVMFFLTEGALLAACIIFRQRKDRKVVPFKESKKAEIVWTTVPGLMLFSLAIVQTGLWTKIRTGFPNDSEAFVVQSYPRQYEWQFRYPNDGSEGSDTKFNTDDNIYMRDSLFVPVNKKVVIKLSSKDVIHSLFIPYARAKIDAVPGMLTRMWFEIDRIPCWDLKEQKMVLLSEDEFKKKKVALTGFKSDKFDMHGELMKADNLVQWKYKYEKMTQIYGCPAEQPGENHTRSDKKEKCKKCGVDLEEIDAYVCENGEPVSKKILSVQNEAQYFLHRYDIACAEL